MKIKLRPWLLAILACVLGSQTLFLHIATADEAEVPEDIKALVQDWSQNKADILVGVKLKDKYGTDEYKKLIRKEVLSLNSPILNGHILSPSDRSAEMYDIAKKGLLSEKGVSANFYFRQRSIFWMTADLTSLSEEDRDLVRQAVRVNIEESHAGYQLVSCLKGLWPVAKPEDRVYLRQVYTRLVKQDRERPVQTGPLAANEYSLVHPSPRTKLLEMLYRLGDTHAITEILEAINNPEPLDRHVWAVFLAGRMGDKRFLEPLRKTLDDQRLAPEPLRFDRHPEARNEKNTRLWRRDLTRVCDVAVRSIHAIAQPEEPWAFAVPIPSTVERDPQRRLWNSDGWYFPDWDEQLALFPKQEVIRSRMWEDEQFLLVEVYVNGFTDEQVEWVKKSVK